MPLKLSPEAQSAYLLELEQLLNRLDSASTHYQVLELDRTASSGEVRAAYVALMRLHPKSREMELDAALEERIERSYAKVVRAFAVLSNFGKRTEYDNGLRRGAVRPLAGVATAASSTAEAPMPWLHAIPAGAPPASGGVADTTSGAVQVERAGAGRITFRCSVKNDGANRRRCQRMPLRIPARVSGVDQEGTKWSEMSHTRDVSGLGMAIQLEHRVEVGSVVHVRSPLPVRLRSYGFADQSYSVYAVVQRVEPGGNRARLVGLEYWGEHPPEGYWEAPWARFTLKWTDRTRRRHPRRRLREKVGVEYLADDGTVVGQAVALAENASRGGARVAFVEPPPLVDYVRIHALERSFTSRAVVRNRIVAGDGHTRLCLQFVDAEFPD